MYPHNQNPNRPYYPPHHYQSGPGYPPPRYNYPPQGYGPDYGYYPPNRPMPQPVPPQPPSAPTKMKKIPANWVKTTINTLKVTGTLTHMLSVIALVLGYFFLFLVNIIETDFWKQYFIYDGINVALVFGPLVAFVSLAIQFLLWISLFFNRNGWLRKSKAYFPGFLTLILLASVAILSLYIAKSLPLAAVTGDNNAMVRKEIIAISYMPLQMVVDKIINHVPQVALLDEGLVLFYSHIKYLTWAMVVWAALSALFGNFFNKSITKTLENAEMYFNYSRY